MTKPFHYYFLVSISLACLACQGETATESEAAHPNIIYILADDLGYGDISALNDSAAFTTPNLDALARRGMSFTDAHSGSAVCTPTRYGILTGRYAWRTSLQGGVSWSWSPPLIAEERTTVADVLKAKNYHTACIGKWHLGLGWGTDNTGEIDMTLPISGGPNALGFDYFFGITASLDIPPYVYIENEHITATSIDTVEAMGGKAFWRRGPVGNDFKHEEVLPVLTEKAVAYIKQQSSTDEPFFLYFPLPAPHTPILPTEAFAGKSGTNAYGDFVLMVDDVVGQIQSALSEMGITDNTLLVFTSDNGCSPMADFEELADFGHDPSGVFRGHKADIFEGGHRVPFLVQWPDVVAAGSGYDGTVCLTDLMASCAAIVGDSLKAGTGEDSFNLLPAFRGDAASIRETTVHHSINGSFALREGKWKLNFCAGSGGWSYPKPNEVASMGLPAVQLYDIAADPGEAHNLAEEEPEVVRRLTQLMQQYIQDGKTRTAAIGENDVEVQLFK